MNNYVLIVDTGIGTWELYKKVFLKWLGLYSQLIYDGWWCTRKSHEQPRGLGSIRDIMSRCMMLLHDHLNWYLITFNLWKCANGQQDITFRYEGFHIS